MGDQQPNALLEALSLSAELELVQHNTKRPFSPQAQGRKQTWRDLGHSVLLSDGSTALFLRLTKLAEVVLPPQDDC